MGDPLSRTIYTSCSVSFLAIGSEGLSPFQCGTGLHLLTFGRASCPYHDSPFSGAGLKKGGIHLYATACCSHVGERSPPLGSGGSSSARSADSEQERYH